MSGSHISTSPPRAFMACRERLHPFAFGFSRISERTSNPLMHEVLQIFLPHSEHKVPSTKTNQLTLFTEGKRINYR
jgi:hypothetical protein